MALKYDNVLFDFDGTIMDSGPGILRCVCEIVEEFGYDMPEEAVLRKFIGPPLKQIFRQVFDISSQETDCVVDRYRELHKESNAILEADVYPGVVGLLQRLRNAGAKVGIASVKRETAVVETLKIHDMMEYFDVVAGGPPGVDIVQKDLVMQDCMERMGIGVQGTVMVGDSLYDAEASEQLGVDFCVALWGYGFDDPDDVTKHRQVFVAKDIPALESFLFT